MVKRPMLNEAINTIAIPSLILLLVIFQRHKILSIPNFPFLLLRPRTRP
jgi:hypothetical protein